MKSNARREYECFATLRMKGSVSLSLSLCVKESWMFCGKRMSLLKPRSGLTPNTLNFTLCTTGNVFSGRRVETCVTSRTRKSARECERTRLRTTLLRFVRVFFEFVSSSESALFSSETFFQHARAHQEEENRVSRISHVIYSSTPLLVILNAQQGECANNEQTKKESTSEKSGEREDGFEG